MKSASELTCRCKSRSRKLAKITSLGSPAVEQSWVTVTHKLQQQLSCAHGADVKHRLRSCRPGVLSLHLHLHIQAVGGHVAVGCYSISKLKPTSPRQ